MHATAVVGKSIRTWSRALGPLLASAAVVLLPFHLLRLWAMRSPQEHGTLAGFARGILTLVEGSEELLLVPIVQGLLTLFVFQRLRGERGELRRSLRLGSRRILALCGVILLRSLPFLIPIAFETDRILRPEGGGDNLTVVLGAMLLAFLVEIVFCVSGPALLVERLGVFSALRRSAALTKTRRFMILRAYVLVGVVAWILELPTRLLKDDLARGSLTEALLQAGIAVAEASLGAVFSVVLYHALRESKEGVSLDELAGVFD